jgi:hypothetical protein
MLPALRLLQSAGCSASSRTCCEFAGDVVAFSDCGELNVIFCDHMISEQQAVANDDYIKCNALALAHDGSAVLTGDPDGSLKLISLKSSEPKTCTAITLPTGQDIDATKHISRIANDGKGRFAVAVDR